ncbi:MAG: hypothetical protein J0I36_07045, partial [Pandoraea sp.]|nr:hypothetical protein [Pandoraea sp.]
MTLKLASMHDYRIDATVGRRPSSALRFAVRTALQFCPFFIPKFVSCASQQTQTTDLARELLYPIRNL